jgi:hypothetical protein
VKLSPAILIDFTHSTADNPEHKQNFPGVMSVNLYMRGWGRNSFEYEHEHEHEQKA